MKQKLIQLATPLARVTAIVLYVTLAMVPGLVGLLAHKQPWAWALIVLSAGLLCYTPRLFVKFFPPPRDGTGFDALY